MLQVEINDVRTQGGLGMAETMTEELLERKSAGGSAAGSAAGPHLKTSGHSWSDEEVYQSTRT